MVIFLAHLARSAKVSFWDSPVSVVRRVSSVVKRQHFTKTSSSHKPLVRIRYNFTEMILR